MMHYNMTPHPQPARANRPVFDLITREELKRLAWDEGKTDAQIANMYGVSTNQVNRKRRQMNLVQGDVTTEQLADIVRLAESVKSLPLQAIDEIRQIVQRYDINH